MTRLPELLFVGAVIALSLAVITPPAAVFAAAWECWFDRSRPKVNRKVSK